jgi:hypothetical protein
MGKSLESKSMVVISKRSITVDLCDPQLEMMGCLNRKVQKTRLFDNDFMDGDLSPKMKSSIYIYYIFLESVEVTTVWKPIFEPLWVSTLTNMINLPMFVTTMEVMECTKLHISQEHRNNL